MSSGLDKHVVAEVTSAPRPPQSQQPQAILAQVATVVQDSLCQLVSVCGTSINVVVPRLVKPPLCWSPADSHGRHGRMRGCVLSQTTPGSSAPCMASPRSLSGGHGAGEGPPPQRSKTEGKSGGGAEGGGVAREAQRHNWLERNSAQPPQVAATFVAAGVPLLNLPSLGGGADGVDGATVRVLTAASEGGEERSC